MLRAQRGARWERLAARADGATAGPAARHLRSWRTLLEAAGLSGRVGLWLRVLARGGGEGTAPLVFGLRLLRSHVSGEERRWS